MPELIEVEAYRRLAELALERPIVEVVAPDAWWLKGGLAAEGLSDALLGRHFLAARRTGKRLMLDTSSSLVAFNHHTPGYRVGNFGQRAGGRRLRERGQGALAAALRSAFLTTVPISRYTQFCRNQVRRRRDAVLSDRVPSWRRPSLPRFMR